MSVTVVITNYLRLSNVHCLINALRKQTVKPLIFVWDNSPQQDFSDSRVDWVIRSSRNARCSARWWMASHADTDFVVIHDDDLIPLHAKVIALTLDAAVRNAPFIVGASGVILNHRLGYWQSKHVGLRAKPIRHNKQVDIVKGFYFCCPTRRLAKVGYLAFDVEDDIAVSARLGDGLAQPHLVLARLQNDLKLLPEGKRSRKHRANHRTMRENARWHFFTGAQSEKDDY